MADQWATTDDHAPTQAHPPLVAGGWASTDDHSPSVPQQKSIGGFLSNVLSSGVNLADNIGSAVAHPIDTIKSIGAIPLGIAEKMGVPMPAPGPGDTDSAKVVDAMLDHFKGRYGSFEKAKEALYHDPVGVLADLSTVAGGAGAVMKGVSGAADIAGASRVASVAGDVANAAKTAAEFTDPVSLVVKPVAYGTRSLIRGSELPEKLYQSALKPGKAASKFPGTPAGSEAAVRGIVQTGMNEGIPISSAGVDKLHSLIEDLGQKIQGKIDAGAGAGVTVDPYAVVNRTADTEAQFAKQVNPEADLAAIKASRQEFLRTQGERPGIPASPGVPAVAPVPAQPIPADVAQELKQGTYQQIKKSYGQLSGAQVEAQKALARGIKEELAAQIPEIADLNARDSRALSLQNALENRVRVATSHNMMGIGTPIAAGTVAGATGSLKLAAVAGIMKAIWDDPAIKSKAAIALNAARSANPQKWGAPSMATAISRVNEYVNGLNAPVPAMAQNQPEPPQPQQQASAAMPQVGDANTHMGAQYKFDGQQWVRQ